MVGLLVAVVEGGAEGISVVRWRSGGETAAVDPEEAFGGGFAAYIHQCGAERAMASIDRELASTSTRIQV
jgi:hypothetical protein